MRKLKCKHLLFFLSLAIPFSFFSTAAMIDQSDYTLEQVLMLSRHGVRAPLDNPKHPMQQSTPKPWPVWNTAGGYLTPKGGVLEAYFGGYFNAWLVKNKMFKENECPTVENVYFYANSLQRTIATAQYFAVGAFPGCNVPVVHKEALGTMDYTFNPIITDGSATFNLGALSSMNSMAGQGGVNGLNSRLKPSYNLVDTLLDYKHSTDCITDKKCSITDYPTVLGIVKGQQPNISGPLFLGTYIVDAFILQYYEGLPMKDVAWGQINSDKDWQTLARIRNSYMNVLFGAPLVAKQISAPLVSYINDTFVTMPSIEKPKFTMLVGHDSNVRSVLSALNIKAFILPDQFEETPIGGKIVFERWKDQNNTQLVKIEYFYQSTAQIREMQKLTMDNPPKSVTLEMMDCPIDVNGFCLLSDFKKALEKIIASE